jgi:hypothetical protein
MAKGRGDNMLGIGGQRNTVSRNAMRGAGSAGKGSAHNAAEQKRELLRRLKEKNEQARAAEKAADD